MTYFLIDIILTAYTRFFCSQMYVYKVIINEPVQPQQDVLLGLKIAYTHTIKPMPTKLPQVARQHTIFAFNSYLLSPYQTIETKTTLQ